MMKILFVCHGNICRSPMAEHVFRELAREAGALSRFEVASAAVSTEEIWGGHGNPMDLRAQRVLRHHCIPFEPGEARLITAADLKAYDLIVLMDRGNLRGLRRLLGDALDEAPKGRVRLLFENAEVSDPWYTGDYEKAYEDIERGCQALLAECLSR